MTTLGSSLGAPPNKSPRLNCEDCSQTFHNRSNLVRHVKRYCGVKEARWEQRQNCHFCDSPSFTSVWKTLSHSLSGKCWKRIRALQQAGQHSSYSPPTEDCWFNLREMEGFLEAWEVAWDTTTKFFEDPTARGGVRIHHPEWTKHPRKTEIRRPQSCPLSVNEQYGGDRSFQARIRRLKYGQRAKNASPLKAPTITTVRKSF